MWTIFACEYNSYKSFANISMCVRVLQVWMESWEHIGIYVLLVASKLQKTEEKKEEKKNRNYLCNFNSCCSASGDDVTIESTLCVCGFQIIKNSLLFHLFSRLSLLVSSTWFLYLTSSKPNRWQIDIFRTGDFRYVFSQFEFTDVARN